MYIYTILSEKDEEAWRKKRKKMLEAAKQPSHLPTSYRICSRQGPGAATRPVQPWHARPDCALCRVPCVQAGPLPKRARGMLNEINTRARIEYCRAVEALAAHTPVHIHAIQHASHGHAAVGATLQLLAWACIWLRRVERDLWGGEEE